jgi:preprotein translocase subunit SecG
MDSLRCWQRTIRHADFTLSASSGHVPQKNRHLEKQRSQSSTEMIYLIVILHVIVSLFLIGVVLIQQGKSADLAGAFGGQGSQTAFGPRGAANLLTKLTTYSAICFMLTSISLTILLSRASTSTSVLSGTKTTQSTPAPAKK